MTAIKRQQKSVRDPGTFESYLRHWYSSDDSLKNVASSGTFKISRKISSSFVLYGSTESKMEPAYAEWQLYGPQTF